MQRWWWLITVGVSDGITIRPGNLSAIFPSNLNVVLYRYEQPELMMIMISGTNKSDVFMYHQ